MCYENVAQVFNFIDSVEACYDTQGQCSEECRNLIENTNEALGCCVNIPIGFRTAGSQTNLSFVVNYTFDNCNERRRDACGGDIITDPGFISEVYS